LHFDERTKKRKRINQHLPNLSSEPSSRRDVADATLLRQSAEKDNQEKANTQRAFRLWLVRHYEFFVEAVPARKLCMGLRSAQH